MNTCNGVVSLAALLLCVPVFAAPDAQRQAQLKHLLAQDCGACHGLYLTGGLGPELTPKTLAGKPRDSLIATVRLGRPGSAMPAWQALLSSEDIGWLVDHLLQGAPIP
ncbi:c-type cytochrome [Pseudomonas rubra]|uniref:Cytochrome c n=1 Tax=Pseudomonas rubra TaxID=2942627 RepID=A0ABT5PGK2_9PSED|nr:cytochrome c [Pseudomonas rubra]MDD1017089.1 cytochrome c [Pseudomonas rubra]MDD1036630.1 cytochrome c [Pseudomonas rubra]MDD1155992.1 cytochrome c [Pseudomonas rubra]